MRQNLNVACDINAVPVGGIDWPLNGNSYATTLEANINQTLTVPSGCNLAIFSYAPQQVFVANTTGSLNLPGGSFSITRGELNPGVRQVSPGDTLNFISSVVAYVQVRFVNNNVRPS